MPLERKFLDEDVYEPVPKKARSSWYSFLAIFMGMWASLAAIGVGISIGQAITPWKGALGLFLGYMVCLVYGFLVGDIGRKEGLSTYPLLGRPFSRFWKILPSLFTFFIAAVFIGIQADAVARVIMSVVGWEITPIGVITNRALFSAALCAVMMITAYKGFRYIKTVSWVAMPIFISILIIGLVLGVGSYQGGLSAILTEEAHAMSFSSVFFLGVALYAGFSAMLPDVSRYVSSRRDLIKACVIGYVISTFIPIWGVIIGPIYGIVYWKIFSLYGITFGVISAIALYLAQWTTNDNNAFTSGLALSTFFRSLKDKWEKVPRLNRRYATLVPATFGTVLAFLGTGAIEPLVMFVSALGSWLPTMGGVMIAHFYVVERRKRKIEAKGLAGIISWVTISLLVQLGIMPYAGIMGIVGAFLLYLVLYYGIEKPIFGEKVIG
jgi:cytosine permease